MNIQEIDVRNIEPKYNHTIARQAGREVNDGLELHLSTFEIMLVVKYRPDSGDRDRSYYTATYTVDHDNDEIRLSNIGDANSKRQTFGMQTLVVALEYAQRAAVAFVEDTGAPDYPIVGPSDLLDAARNDATGDDVTVHPALEVHDG